MGIQLSGSPASASNPTLTGAAAKLDANRVADLSKSNRSLTRTAPPAAPAKPAKPAPNPLTAPLPRIYGLSSAQVRNAWSIVLEGHNMGINPRGQQIAIATALQESNLLNLTRAVDHDSLGLFQQRPSSGWGSPRQLTNPTYAAHAFYAVLVHYKGAWGCLTCAAQDVQRSAFPYAYAQHTSFALRIVTILDKRFQ